MSRIHPSYIGRGRLRPAGRVWDVPEPINSGRPYANRMSDRDASRDGGEDGTTGSEGAEGEATGSEGGSETTSSGFQSDLDWPIAKVGRLAMAVFAIVFALVVASLVTELTTSTAVRFGVVGEATNAGQLFRTVVQFAGFLIAVLAYLAATGEWNVVDVGRPRLGDAKPIVVAAAALLALQYGALYGLRAVGVTTGQNVAVVPAGDPVTYYLAMIVVSIAVVGPVEELLFRGVVQGGLRRAFDATPAIVLASLLFGLVHLPAVTGTLTERLAYAGVVVALGCLLGYLYERTGNVLVPGLAHGAYNAAIYAVLLAGVV